MCSHLFTPSRALALTETDRELPHPPARESKKAPILMTNETIASRIVDLVKGIFGQKSPEKPAAEDAPTTTTASDKPGSAADTAGDAKDTGTGGSADDSVEQQDEAPGTSEASAASDDDTEDSEDKPSILEGQDTEAIAEELEVAEAATVSASRESMDNAAAAAAAGGEALPVPNYDSVTLPSMRARLRKLSLEDVRALRAYEDANEARADFLKMYDNRIAKLESEG